MKCNVLLSRNYPQSQSPLLLRLQTGKPLRRRSRGENLRLAGAPSSPARAWSTTCSRRSELPHPPPAPPPPPRRSCPRPPVSAPNSPVSLSSFLSVQMRRREAPSRARAVTTTTVRSAPSRSSSPSRWRPASRAGPGSPVRPRPGGSAWPGSWRRI